jgi:hypothetical protein
MNGKSFFHHSRILKLIGILAGLFIIFVAGFSIMLQVSPSIGAYGADYLRKIVGEQPVALLETAVFRMQDTIKRTEVNLGLEKPANPWQPNSASDVKASTGLASQSPQKTITGSSGGQIIPDTTGPAPSPTLQAQPAQPDVWTPPAVTPLGTLEGAGSWTPYITDSTGKVVAYRTFLQPDPTRSYAMTAVVAFNLKQVQLHYQVGFGEPYAPGVSKFSNGKIPGNFLSPNVLLAAFNGGFKVEHGAFGSMENGKTSVPPRNGFATVAIYRDGHVQIGEWGKDLGLTPDMVAFRQNGPLVIRNGLVTHQVDTPNYWGYTVNASAITWRSGIAIDQPGNTLYYFAGSYLTIHSLADAMTAVHAWNAMQLDINNFWVNFESFTPTGDTLTPEPLFPKEMAANTSRFLSAYVRDFFYVTAVTP